MTEQELMQQELLQQEVIQRNLMELLKHQVQRFCGCDSTSVTTEKAKELLASALYTLKVAAGEHAADAEEESCSQPAFDRKAPAMQGMPGQEEYSFLAGHDLPTLLRNGQEVLKRKVREGKVDLALLVQDLPPIRTVYYEETLRNLERFFLRYDLYYGAHQIPCSMDYPLLCPVSEALSGISFISEYLRRLQIENDFLHAFDKTQLEHLYRYYTPGYEEMFFNLCEPVLTNALGFCMIGEEMTVLLFHDEQREAVLTLLRGKNKEEIREIVDRSTHLVAKETGMTAQEECVYLLQAAGEVVPRLYEGVLLENLDRVLVGV